MLRHLKVGNSLNDHAEAHSGATFRWGERLCRAPKARLVHLGITLKSHSSFEPSQIAHKLLNFSNTFADFNNIWDVVNQPMQLFYDIIKVSRTKIKDCSWRQTTGKAIFFLNISRDLVDFGTNGNKILVHLLSQTNTF